MRGVNPLCCLRRVTPFALLSVLSIVPTEPPPAAAAANGSAALLPPPRHPHFQKTLECRISEQLQVTVRYQTVTFDQKGAEQLAPGKAWHLAGATFATSADLVVGGCEVKAGTYALSARKRDDKTWELVLHAGQGFSTKIPADAHVLTTQFVGDAVRQEHLHIDVQPAGDKEHTRLQLEVRFDTLLATALLEPR